VKRPRQSRSTTLSQASSHRRRWAWIAALVAAGVVSYFNALNGPFIFDDVGAVVQNSSIRQLSTAGPLSPPANTSVAGRPLVNLSFALNYAAVGLDPFGYHIFNLALHLTCGVLFFIIVRKTLELIRAGETDAEWVAFGSALLWIVHPLNSEAVDYVTQRTELMMAACYLSALYAAIRAFGSQSSVWTWIATLSCIAGVACKETIVTAPIAIAFYDRAYLFESYASAFRVRGRLYLALCSSWVLAALLLIRGGQSAAGGFTSTRWSVASYVLHQPGMILHYLWLAVWPRALTLYYGWTLPTSFAQNAAAIGVVALIVAGIAALWFYNRRLAYPAVWVFVTLAPTSSVIPIATEVGAERRMYLPLAGIVTLVVLGVRGVARRSAPPGRSVRWANLALMVLAAVLCARTVNRNRDFASALVMARSVLASWPTANAHYLVGTELAAAGERREAIAELRRATADYPPAHFDLGRVLVESGESDEGVTELQRFIEQEPDALAARAAEGLIGDALASRQAFADAIPHYRRYLEAYPNDIAGWTGLGVALAASGQASAATEAFRSVARLNPGDAHAEINLARSMIDAGDLEGAAVIVQQQIAAHPDAAAPFDLLGRIRAANGDVAGAREAFERALMVDPGFVPAREALADLGAAGRRK